jgi:hypothetical protein
MVLACAAMLFASVAPAALGILSRASVLVASFVVLGVSALTRPGARPTEPTEELAPAPSGAVSVVVAVLAVGCVAVYELARLRVLATQPLTDIDMLGFHVPGVARFIQTGTLWRVDQFLPGFATAQYPNDGDFLLLSAVLPWRNLAFVRFVPVPFYLFMGVGIYALALELRATRAAAATMAAAVITVPALALLALDGLPDAIALATLAAGLVFLLRHWRSRRSDELVVAGLALGLSFGTKWYGSTSVAVVLVVWVARNLLARRSLLRLARETATLAGLIIAGGGIWVIRNIVESANPIYPKAVSVLGVHLFPGSHGDIVDRYGYRIADYLGAPHVLRNYIYPAFRDRAGITALVLLVGLAIAGVAAIRATRRPARRDGTAAWTLGLVVIVLGICAEYAITPGSAYGPKNLPVQTFANVRWLMPAIMIAAAVSAQAVLALGRWGVLLELAALAGAVEGTRLGPGVPASAVALVVLVLAGVAAAGLVAKRWTAARRWQAWRARRRTVAAVVLATASTLALAAVGRLDQRRFDVHTYASFDPSFAWIESHAAARHRIGITGIWSTTGLPPTLPAFGPRLGNYVAYVGDRVRHSLHVPASESSFEAQLRRGRYDLLLIGLQDTAHTDVWARAAGYRLVSHSDRLALYAAPARGS